MRPPIIHETSNPDATQPEVITVWYCTKLGHCGMIVYTQEIAIGKLAEGFDIEIGQVIRIPQTS